MARAIDRQSCSHFLTIIDLSHSFGGLKALTDFSLEIFPGELVGLIGPNGAGKTTVFNLITGVFRISQGRISFRGEDISDWRSHRITAAGIARTFQNIRLFKELSVLDNVRLGAFAQHRYTLLDALRRSRRFTAAEQQVTRQAFELLERFNLTHYAHTPARHLPYGEQRRIEMARALISRPQLLLLDEPAAGMNQSETEDLIRRIRQLQDDFALTILLIEHQMRVVVNLCQRLTVLDFGETIAAGSPQEIQRHPAVLEAYLGKDGDLGSDSPGAGRGDPMKDDLSRPPLTPLLAVEDLWVSYDRIDAVRGVSFRRGRRRDRHPHRGQRGGEVIDLAGNIRDAAGGPRQGDPGRRGPPGGAGPPAGGPGHRPRPGGPGHLRQPDGPGKSAPGDLPAPGRRD